TWPLSNARKDGAAPIAVAFRHSAVMAMANARSTCGVAARGRRGRKGVIVSSPWLIRIDSMAQASGRQTSCDGSQIHGLNRKKKALPAPPLASQEWRTPGVRIPIVHAV